MRAWTSPRLRRRVPLCRVTTMGGRYDIQRRLIRQAARMAGDSLFERLEEEWLADLSEQTRWMSRLRFLIGCYWASLVISREGLVASIPVAAPPMAEGPTMTVCVQRAFPRFLRETSQTG